MDNNNAFENEISFEEEYEKAKLTAVNYQVCELGEFRNSISDACLDAYEGRRSVQGFIKFASALIKDEEGYFKQYNIEAQQLFINSLRSQDIDLELVREETQRNAETGRRNVETEALFRRQTANLTGMLNSLVGQGAISSGLCKMYFSSQLLEDAGIIPNKKSFDGRLVRLNTAMLYKQHKFNLLREDSEGYSGLINDLTTKSIDNDRDSEGEIAAIPMERIPEFLKIIDSRIGVFHLDPNRVLDIILDFFITQLTVNYNFWIELIKQSGWIQKLSYIDKMTGESSRNPSGIMAQLICFRFYNYHLDESVAPKELYLAIAILLKNGLILLGDILPHMYPYPEAMHRESEAYNTHMTEEMTSTGSNGLGAYGPLGEEGTTQKIKKSKPSPGDGNDSTDENARRGYKANDVVELVKALLSIGDLKNAKLMLAKYRNLVEMYPQLAYDIYRLCGIVLEPAYEIYVPEKTKNLYQHFSECSYQSRMKSALTTNEIFNPKIPDQIELTRKPVIDALLNDVQDLKKKERYVFFYREWRDQLEFCNTFEDLTTKFMPLMRLAGYKTYLATDLIQKLVLIVGGLIERGESEFPESRIHCMNILREFLLPAISFSGGNPGTMASIWEILCHLSYQERYALYGEWYNVFYSKNDQTKLLKARVERLVKYVMRRVSRNDIRRCGRDLGKLAHSNPMIVFNVVLDQIETFDNLAPLMADACRYLGDFSYDVLGYVLSYKWTGWDAAGRGSKDKEKPDGAPDSWLRSLAVFTGMLFKKQDIDATPLLRYLSYRFRQDDSFSDLILLNELVTKMGGIEIFESGFTDDQITSATCSDFLKTEAFLPVVPDNRRASRRVLNRLKESLRRGNVGFEILVLLYRLEEVITSEFGASAIGRCARLERVHQSRLQYFELLTSLFEGEEYAALVPNVDVLVNDYGLSLDIAMNLNRPKTQYSIATNIRTPINPDELWAPFKPLVEIVPTLLDDPPIPTMFTAEFYVVFWQLSLYDIYCPVGHYDAAIKCHDDMIKQCQNPNSTYSTSHRPSFVTKSERQAIASKEALEEDLRKHKAHVEKVMTFLKDSESRWFPSSMHREKLIMSILKHCMLPRSKQSEVDAVFCYEFAMLMHGINAKNFSSLTLIDKVLSENIPADFVAFSEYEVRIHSRFISKILSKMGSWHSDGVKYIKEALGQGLIGFQKNWPSEPAETVATEDLLSHTEFKRVLGKWHVKVYGVIEQSLQSGEAHSIKNAIVLLSYFISSFPATVELGDNIQRIIAKLSREESPGKIKTLAASYLGLLSKQQPRWVSKSDFWGYKDTSSTTKPGSTSSTTTKEPGSNSKTQTKESGSSSKTQTKESGSSSRTQTTENGKDDSSRRRDHNNETSSSNKHSSSSRPTSPTSSRRGESSRNSNSQAAPSSPSSDRKRVRETEAIRPEKSPRLDDSSSSRHRSSNVASSSSTRNSLRESSTKESTSRTGTPLRDSRTRDPTRDAISSNRKEASSPRTHIASSSHNNGSSSSQNPPNSSSVSSTSNMRSDDRSIRSSRVSSSNPPADSSSSRHDDRRSANNSSTLRSSSPSRSGSKRGIDLDRERDRSDRPEKRRDIRDERTRDDRSRVDDRSYSRRIDDRRNDDRRNDVRREKDHHSSGSSRSGRRH